MMYCEVGLAEHAAWYNEQECQLNWMTERWVGPRVAALCPCHVHSLMATNADLNSPRYRKSQGYAWQRCHSYSGVTITLDITLIVVIHQ